MERIKTKIIIAVAERLRDARDSDAKTDLIEELSENLYQRYLDLVAGGMSEEQAYKSAMEDLGDVSELLEYLRNMDGNEQAGDQSAGEGRHGGHGQHMNDFFKGFEEVVRETITQTKDAVDQAKIITRDIARKFSEKYPDGIKINCGFDSEKGGFFWESNRKGRLVEIAKLPGETVNALDIQLHNGDVDINVAAQDAVEVSGDAEDLEVRLDDDGVLYIRQGKTASSSAAFGRGLARTDVELTLPDKLWSFVRVNTVNGDVQFHDVLEMSELEIQTVSGDIGVDNACCPKMTIMTVSGDISGEDMTGNLCAESKSGDLTLSGKFVELKARSMSGDIELSGDAEFVTCSSMSGDVSVEVETLPCELNVKSTSGDCLARIPAGQGFTVNLHTVSGDLNTDFELVGTIGRKSGSAIYLDGGDRSFDLGSTSGDVTLEKI